MKTEKEEITVSGIITLVGSTLIITDEFGDNEVQVFVTNNDERILEEAFKNFNKNQ